MTLFIQPENQNILWETIHKTKYLDSVFGSQTNEKNEWFKKYIETKYNQLPANITKEDLFRINREVLTVMITDLKKIITTQSRAEKQKTVNKGQKIQLSDYELVENQYKQFLETPKPQAIDFSEKIEDEVITNMDELIENHRKMRELDLELIPVPEERSVEPFVQMSVEPLVQKPVEKHVHFETELDVLKKIDEKLTIMFEWMKQQSSPTKIISKENKIE